jgi:hypothetical protein
MHVCIKITKYIYLYKEREKKRERERRIERCKNGYMGTL